MSRPFPREEILLRNCNILWLMLVMEYISASCWSSIACRSWYALIICFSICRGLRSGVLLIWVCSISTTSLMKEVESNWNWLILTIGLFALKDSWIADPVGWVTRASLKTIGCWGMFGMGVKGLTVAVGLVFFSFHIVFNVLWKSFRVMTVCNFASTKVISGGESRCSTIWV